MTGRLNRLLLFRLACVLACALSSNLLLAQSDTSPSDGALSDSKWYDSETGDVGPIYRRW